MTYRDRLTSKLAKREEWADKAAAKASAHFETAHRTLDGIPFGQPILVGHHSEAGHRNALSRSDAQMAHGIERTDMASHHAQSAHGIARQLETSIFSDDHDAISALEARISGREQEAEGMKAENALFRKAKGATVAEKLIGMVTDGVLSEEAAVLWSTNISRHHWDPVPHPGWELTNLRATIRRDKERIKEIQARATKLSKAEADGGVTVIEILYGGQPTGQIAVTFASKPKRDILDALKDAGFHWSNPSWYGQSNKLPEGIRDA